MNRTELNGAFALDGEICYEGLYPDVSFRNGFSLWRQEINPGGVLSVNPAGPHFSFLFFRPQFLSTTHSVKELRANPKYRFQGPYLGSLSRSSGYLYGSKSLYRRGVECELAFTYSKESIGIRLSGVAGPVVPGNGESNKSQRLFDIWMNLPVSQILQVAPDCGEVGLQTLIANLDQL